MRLNNYKPMIWIPCRCPQCGHEQEAEQTHLAERGANCEACGQPTAPAAREETP